MGFHIVVDSNFHLITGSESLMHMMSMLAQPRCLLLFITSSTLFACTGTVLQHTPSLSVPSNSKYARALLLHLACWQPAVRVGPQVPNSLATVSRHAFPASQYHTHARDAVKQVCCDLAICWQRLQGYFAITGLHALHTLQSLGRVTGIGLGFVMLAAGLLILHPAGSVPCQRLLNSCGGLLLSAAVMIMHC